MSEQFTDRIDAPLAPDAADRRSTAGAGAASVLTANDLLSGRVVWWAGGGWSEAFGDAVRDDAAALGAVGAREEAADRVVGAAAIALDPDGRPAGLRERRRLSGPSIALPGSTTPTAATNGG